MIEFAIFVPIGSSFRLVSTAIVAETEKSPYSFFTSRDLFSPAAHWPPSLSGIIYPRNFRDKGGAAPAVRNKGKYDIITTILGPFVGATTDGNNSNDERKST